MLESTKKCGWKTSEFAHNGDQVHVSPKGQMVKNGREIMFFSIIVENLKDTEILQSVHWCQETTLIIEFLSDILQNTSIVIFLTWKKSPVSFAHVQTWGIPWGYVPCMGTLYVYCKGTQYIKNLILNEIYKLTFGILLVG